MYTHVPLLPGRGAQRRTAPPSCSAPRHSGSRCGPRALASPAPPHLHPWHPSGSAAAQPAAPRAATSTPRPPMPSSRPWSGSPTPTAPAHMPMPIVCTESQTNPANRNPPRSNSWKSSTLPGSDNFCSQHASRIRPLCNSCAPGRTVLGRADDNQRLLAAENPRKLAAHVVHSNASAACVAARGDDKPYWRASPRPHCDPIRHCRRRHSRERPACSASGRRTRRTPRRCRCRGPSCRRSAATGGEATPPERRAPALPRGVARRRRHLSARSLMLT